MRRRDKKKKYILMGMIAFVFLLTVGYAAFAQVLKITGTSTYTSNDFNVYISKVTYVKTGGTVNQTSTTGDDFTAKINNSETNPYIGTSGTSVNLGAEFTYGNQNITYTVEITNAGNKDVNFSNITVPSNSSEYITWSNNAKEKCSSVTKGNKCTFTVNVKTANTVKQTADNSSYDLNVGFIESTGEIVEAIGSKMKSVEDIAYGVGAYYTDTYQPYIKTATFTNTNEVPENAVESWDMSEAGDGSVMAWVIEKGPGNCILYEGGTPESCDKTYDLYIGAKGKVIANEKLTDLFFSFYSLESIDFTYFDTSNTTSMYRMFAMCMSLKNVNFEKLNTSNVKNMAEMFYYCTSIKTLDLSSFDTRSLSNYMNPGEYNSGMSNMFYYTPSLTKVTVGCGWNTDNVTNMSSMFDDSGISSVTKVCQ